MKDKIGIVSAFFIVIGALSIPIIGIMHIWNVDNIFYANCFYTACCIVILAFILCFITETL